MIIANWKMNGSAEEVRSWILSVSSKIRLEEEKTCVFCPPACYLNLASILIKEQKADLRLGSQIINYGCGSALTGGLNARMLRDVCADYVLIGHSEQRSYLEEDNNVIFAKLEDALNENLSVIFCIGENNETKNKNQTEKFLSQQLAVLRGLNLESVIVAYEPIWAIGTGQNADKEYIEKIHRFIKEYSIENLDLEESISVVYGGSVKLDNCEEISSSSVVDGLLIGGASLDPNTFSSIYNLS